jgi:hypothetical protein
MENPISKNLIDKAEPMMRRLGDKSNDTNIQINKLKNSLKSETKENEKPIKKKKKEAIEATGAASAGAYSAPLFSQSQPEKSSQAAKVKVVEEGLTGGETAEATSAGSSGQYSTPGWVAPNKKQWRGRAKTQIPGGQFVTIKKKCQKFPYCNQGDINALKLSENKLVKDSISNIAKKFGINEDIVKAILLHEMKESKTKRKK